MLIRVTERNDNTRILLNSSHILMVRPIAAGGSTIYLACGSLHHPDLLKVKESVEELTQALQLAGDLPAPLPAAASVSAAH
ncbi:hypothetical protein [Chelatococcus reniformis]|uniref:Uncharacterized protein n=1 Tax=Chelatococcus reniformis TaxID=1494448 RepID=A0A916X7K3_9HYPH|nr:hypothetical protein [Chelatococcus reniformis]GGC45593.1 hypothetical protein GCM10010994_00920 [Chelatococcus reniformis]